MRKAKVMEEKRLIKMGYERIKTKRSKTGLQKGRNGGLSKW